MTVILYRNLERTIAHLPGVKTAVRAEAEKLAGTARTRLAAHRITGTTQIEVTSGKVDSFVSMVGPGAVSIEYGRSAFTRPDGRYVGAMQGLYIISSLLGGA